MNYFIILKQILMQDEDEVNLLRLHFYQAVFWYSPLIFINKLVVFQIAFPIYACPKTKQIT